MTLYTVAYLCCGLIIAAGLMSFYLFRRASKTCDKVISRLDESEEAINDYFVNKQKDNLDELVADIKEQKVSNKQSVAKKPVTARKSTNTRKNKTNENKTNIK